MLWVMGFGIIFLLLAVMYAIWGVAEAVLLRRARSAPVQAEGKVCGLVQHRPLMKYEKQGRVPQLAFQYWGRTTGNGAHGVLSIPQAFSRWNSYPCVEFAAGGDTVAWLSKQGGKKGMWSIGQSVQLRYHPDSPEEYFLTDDRAARHAIRMDFVWALVFALVSAALFAVYLF